MKTFAVTVDLTLTQLGDSKQLSCVSVSSADNGDIHVASRGDVPRLPLRNMLALSKEVSRLVNWSGQNVLWSHGGNTVVTFRRRTTGRVKRSVHWWRLLGVMLWH